MLLRQLTRMHHDQAHLFLHDPLLTLLHLSLPHDAVPMPAAGRCRLGPPRLLSDQGQGALLLSPGFEGLPYGPGARDECDQVDLVLQTPAQRAATRGLTLRHHPTHPLPTPRQTCLHRAWRFHTITPVAITHADASGDAPIASHAETEEHLLEIGPARLCEAQRLAAVPPGSAGHSPTPHRTPWSWCPDAPRGARWSTLPAL